MKLGFYSHIPISRINSKVYIPGFIGVYLEKISEYCDNLVLITHEEFFSELKFDFELKNNKIRILSMGKKHNSVHRFFFGIFNLLSIKKELNSIDHIIVRSPTPLSHWFKFLFSRKSVHYLIVADEYEGAKNLKVKNIRDAFLKIFLYLNDFFLQISVMNTISYANSIKLKNKFSKYVELNLVSTSNLSNTDYVEELNFSFSKITKILYVGRYDLSKGIIETIKAIKELKKQNINCSYEIVGWDDDPNNANINYIQSFINNIRLKKEINILGKINYGEKLNEIYRNSDILVCASYHESFPRTILEAMANSTLVIASSVGSIPYEIKDRYHCLLIKPKNHNEIVNSIKELINDFELRKKLIKNSFEFSKSRNIEYSISNLISKLRNV